MKQFIYTLSKGLFYAFSVFFVFIVFFSILAFAEYQLGWDIPLVEIYENTDQKYAKIRLPFIDFKVEFIFSLLVVMTMWIGIIFYTIYFYTLKEFFNVFIEEKVFSGKSLNRLKTFFYINLIPLVYAIGFSFYQIIRDGAIKFEEDQGIAIFHLFIAFLVYLYMDIIKKGNIVQQENDLTI